MNPALQLKSPQQAPNKLKGMLLILISWVFFTSVIALSKTLSVKTSIPTVLLFQSGVSMIATLPWVIHSRGKSLKLSKYRPILIRSIAGYLNYAFVFLAVQRISLVDTVLLNNSAPLFIPLIIWLWKRVKIGKQLWWGIAIGFVGIALILKPDKEIANFGSIFGIGAAICMSVSMIAQRRLVKREKIHAVLFYYFFISTIISIPFVINVWTPLDMETLLLLVGSGVLFVLGQILFLVALKYEKPSFLSSFNYSSVIYGAFIQWFFWDQIPDWITIVGILVVIAGGIITITHTTGRGITGGLGRDRSLR